MKKETIIAWHFLPEDCRTRWGNPRRRPIRPGRVEVWRGPLAPCRSGLHASIKSLDALGYAPGPMVRLVELSGRILRDLDKCVASRRRTIAGPVDATNTLRRFTMWCVRRAPAVLTKCSTVWDQAWYTAWHAAWDIAYNEKLDTRDREEWYLVRAEQNRRLDRMLRKLLGVKA